MSGTVWLTPLLLLSSVGAVPPRPNGPTFASTAAFDRIVTDFMVAKGIVGASVAVTVRGQLAYEQGYGAANRSTGSRVQPNSVFRIASLTKMHTSAAILLLEQQGRLKLSDRVFGPAPSLLSNLTGTPPTYPGAEVDSRLHKITVHHLLHHIGGWCTRGRGDAAVCNAPDPMFEPTAISTALGVTSPPGPDDIVRYMAAQPLQYDPGTAYAYSNFGYCVLGRVIEAVTGRAYYEFVRTELWDKLQLPREEIGFGRSLLGEEATNEVAYYVHGVVHNVTSVFPPYGPVLPQYGGFNLEAMDSHGAVIASARAVAQFATSLPRWTNGAANRTAQSKDGSPLLTNSTWSQALEKPSCGECKTTDWPQVWYGMGWMVRPVVGDDGNHANVWHDGALDGTNTIVVHSGEAPKAEARQWVMLLNGRCDGAEDPMMWQATRTVATGTWPLLAASTKRAQCTSQLQQLCGRAKRANKGNCLICCGEHQSALQTAGCDQPEIDSFCG